MRILRMIKVFFRLKWQEISRPFRYWAWDNIMSHIGALVLAIILVACALSITFGIFSGIGWIFNTYTTQFTLVEVDVKHLYELGVIMTLLFLVLVGVPCVGLWLLWKLGKWLWANAKEARRIVNEEDRSKL